MRRAGAIYSSPLQLREPEHNYITKSSNDRSYQPHLRQSVILSKLFMANVESLQSFELYEVMYACSKCPPKVAAQTAVYGPTIFASDFRSAVAEAKKGAPLCRLHKTPMQALVAKLEKQK